MAARTLEQVQHGYKLEEKVFIRIGWEAAIKSLEGVQTQPTNKQSMAALFDKTGDTPFSELYKLVDENFSSTNNRMVGSSTDGHSEICLCLSCSRLQSNGGSCQPNTNSFVTACGGYSGKLSPVA